MAKSKDKIALKRNAQPPTPEVDYDVIGFIEGQPPPDPNAGWLKRLWYKLTGAI